LLALDKGTFDALAQNSLALGYLLSRSAVQYLTLDERKAIVNRISPEIRQKKVADFMRSHPTVVQEADSVMSALQTFKQTAASMLPVVNEDQQCKGWLRLDFVFDLLHQGKARAESAVHDLLILPFIAVRPDELVEEALLRFAQTPDRELAVRDNNGQLIGTLALLDLVLATHASRP
jgi:predicted transcriptional regulator